jgi:predicted Ser/Thr protein kinase
LEFEPKDKHTIIGKGMYGTVYEGRCRGLRVAIKVLNDQKMDARTMKKFKAEVELMACVLMIPCCYFIIERRKYLN